MARINKSKSFYKKQLNNIIKLTSKKCPEVLKMKINTDKYCEDTKYRKIINWKLKHFKQYKEVTRINNIRTKEYRREWQINNMERLREARHRYEETHRELIRQRAHISFERWTINNPRRAMLTSAAAHIARAVISRLGIRPTVCPHCGRSNCNIDFHHPNHLFWWKGTFCCKSCHYFFNRDKVPASDKIIDLKKLLRESSSH